MLLPYYAEQYPVPTQPNKATYCVYFPLYARVDATPTAEEYVHARFLLGYVSWISDKV